jgi:hypothetical protein
VDAITHIKNAAKRFGASYALWALYRKAKRLREGLPLSPQIQFLIIGSAKCGTTSLHHYLNLHSDIYLPVGVGINDESGLFLANSEQRIKQLTNRDIRRGMSDMALYEQVVEGYGGESVIGEETSDYTKRPYRTVCFDRINRHNPDMKFILIARDPIEKLRSQYRHFIRHGAITKETDFAEEIASFDYYMYASAYYYQLEPYVERFGKEKIYVLTLEDLSQNPQRELDELFNFLGVESEDLPYEAMTRHNVNVDVTDQQASIQEIPPRTLEFIARDAERFQKYLDRDLRGIWPSLSAVC